MKRIFLVVVLLAASSRLDPGQTISRKMFPKSEPGDKSGKAAQEILEVKRQYDEAQLKNDFAWFDRRLVDDYIYLLPDTELSKAQTIMDLKSGDLKLDTAVGDDMRVRVYGDTAVVTGRFTGKGRYKGEAFSTLQRFTSVWIKRQGRWQAITEHATEIPQK